MPPKRGPTSAARSFPASWLERYRPTPDFRHYSQFRAEQIAEKNRKRMQRDKKRKERERAGGFGVAACLEDACDGDPQACKRLRRTQPASVSRQVEGNRSKKKGTKPKTKAGDGIAAANEEDEDEAKQAVEAAEPQVELYESKERQEGILELLQEHLSGGPAPAASAGAGYSAPELAPALAPGSGPVPAALVALVPAMVAGMPAQIPAAPMASPAVGPQGMAAPAVWTPAGTPAGGNKAKALELLHSAREATKAKRGAGALTAQQGLLSPRSGSASEMTALKAQLQAALAREKALEKKIETLEADRTFSRRPSVGANCPGTTGEQEALKQEKTRLTMEELEQENAQMREGYAAMQMRVSHLAAERSQLLEEMTELSRRLSQQEKALQEEEVRSKTSEELLKEQVEKAIKATADLASKVERRLRQS